jgi:hypothetical protein
MKLDDYLKQVITVEELPMMRTLPQFNAVSGEIDLSRLIVARQELRIAAQQIGTSIMQINELLDKYEVEISSE